MKATHRVVSGVCRNDVRPSLSCLQITWRILGRVLKRRSVTSCGELKHVMHAECHTGACEGGYKCAIGILASCYSRPLHKVAREYIYQQPTRKFAFLRKLVVTELTKKSHTFTHCNPQLQYRSQKELAPIYTLSQLNPAHTHTHTHVFF